MGVDPAIDITGPQRETVLALLERYLPGTTAWGYGSRVKGMSRPQSDLDLVVFATPEQSGQIGGLREAFEESNLPFRVDLFVWSEVPESFRRRIELEHVVVTPMNEVSPAGG
jgi:predicted nucleotidyltransferase